jgi:hypothetical protein
LSIVETCSLLFPAVLTFSFFTFSSWWSTSIPISSSCSFWLREQWMLSVGHPLPPNSSHSSPRTILMM